MSGEKLYRLYCEICNWKMITDGTDDSVKALHQVVTSPIPRGVPKVDPESKKVVEPKPILQPKKFKCPQCGRLVIPKVIDDPQKNQTEKLEADERKRKRNEEEDWFVRNQGGSKRP